MVDAHCHLYEASDIGSEVQRFKDIGGTAMICAGAGLETSRRSIEIAGKYPEVFATVGAHPEGGFDAKKEDFLKLIGEKVVAIGECGLDFFETTTEAEKVKQRELFKFNIELARETQLPLVVHCRNAFEDLHEIIKNQDSIINGVQLHCFTGTHDWAKKFLGLGCYLSFGGIITFKKSEELREVAKLVPEDLLLVETDSPYLSPELVRGEPNTPANVKIVAELAAKLRGTTLAEIDRITTMNARKLFRL